MSGLLKLTDCLSYCSIVLYRTPHPVSSFALCPHLYVLHLCLIVLPLLLYLILASLQCEVALTLLSSTLPHVITIMCGATAALVLPFKGFNWEAMEVGCSMWISSN